jgi:ferrous iron transport protein A
MILNFGLEVRVSANVVKLNQLQKNQNARVIAFENVQTKNLADPVKEVLLKRMMEMGIVKGTEIKLMHEAPFGRDPIAVEVRGALLGLRRDEAELIIVEIL